MLVRLKGIHRVRRRLASGGIRYHYYAWRGGPSFFTSETKVREPVPEDFREAYHAAGKGRVKPATDASSPIAALIRKFRAEVFDSLDESTKDSYERGFLDIDRKFGEAEIGAFTEPAMRSAVKSWHRGFKDHPRAADMRLGTLVRILNFAVDEGLIAPHVCAKIERLHESDRSAIIWEPGEIELFIAGDRAKKVPPASFPLLLALTLLRLGGLRRGDAVRISLTADRGDWLEWKTGKSRGRTEIVVPVVSELRAVLEAARRWRAERKVQATTILFNSRGLPWTSRGLGSSIDTRRERLGIEKHIHDLRGTAATELMRKGFSDQELAEIIGWSSEDLAAIRRKYVARAAIVSAAIARLERDRSR